MTELSLLEVSSKQSLEKWKSEMLQGLCKFNGLWAVRKFIHSLNNVGLVGKFSLSDPGLCKTLLKPYLMVNLELTEIIMAAFSSVYHFMS